MSRTLVGNKIVDHSDVAGASVTFDLQKYTMTCNVCET